MRYRPTRELRSASSGIGTSLHLSGELLKAMAGVQFTHVPYSAPGLTDVVSGQVQGISSSFELVRAGKLRALGVTTREHSDILPDVPPIADTLAGYEASSFYGVGAPKDTPSEIVDLLNREIDTALSDPEIRQRVADLGAIALHGNAGAFGSMLAGARWRKVVELAGVKKERHDELATHLRTWKRRETLADLDQTGYPSLYLALSVQARETTVGCRPISDTGSGNAVRTAADKSSQPSESR